MRIAIIGNSHIAALKIAVRDHLFATDEFDIVFWGLAGQNFDSIVYDGGCFQTPHRDFVLEVSGGRYAALPAADFDAIIFHALPLNLPLYLLCLRRASGDLRHFSRAFMCEGLLSALDQSPTFRLMRSLTGGYEGRVLVSAMSLLSQDSTVLSGMSVAAEELEYLNSCIAAALSHVSAEYVAQPSDTLFEHKYTKRQYSVDSVRLRGGLMIKHPDDDHDHMNGYYGARVLEEITARLAEPVRLAAPPARMAAR